MAVAHPYDLTIEVGGGAPSRLTLPAVPPRDQPLPAPDLRPAKPLVEPPSFAFEPPAWRVTRDHSAGTVEVQLRTNNGTRLPDGTLYHAQSEATTSVDEARPAKASIVGVSTLSLEAPERTTVSRARGEIRSDDDELPRDRPARRHDRRDAVPLAPLEPVLSPQPPLSAGVGLPSIRHLNISGEGLRDVTEGLAVDVLRRLGRGDRLDDVARDAGIDPRRSARRLAGRDAAAPAGLRRRSNGGARARAAGSRSCATTERVPHVFAATDEDLFFGYGYAQAQDRLFQMDLRRRRAHGRLAEVLGKEGIEPDVLARTVDLSGLAARRARTPRTGDPRAARRLRGRRQRR